MTSETGSTPVSSPTTGSSTTGSPTTGSPTTASPTSTTETDNNLADNIYIREEVSSTPVTVNLIDTDDNTVRWSSVWAGATTAVATFLLLQLLFFGFGWLTLDPGEPDPNRAGPPSSVYLMSGLAGLLAFIAGGVVAGATAPRRGVRAGLVQGLLVWALGVTSILVLTLLGGGSLFGAFSDAVNRVSDISAAIRQQSLGITPAILDAARDATRWAALALTLLLASSVLGGVLGSTVLARSEKRT